MFQEFNVTDKEITKTQTSETPRNGSELARSASVFLEDPVVSARSVSQNPSEAPSSPRPHLSREMSADSNVSLSSSTSSKSKRSSFTSLSSLRKRLQRSNTNSDSLPEMTLPSRRIFRRSISVDPGVRLFVRWSACVLWSVYVT